MSAVRKDDLSHFQRSAPHVERAVVSPALRAKRVFDVLGATVLLVVSAPLFALIPLAIRLDTRGSAIFRQTRIGQRGTRFTLLKFRTMTDDAESRQAELLDANDVDGPAFKMRDDPRVTRVGRFLRRWSLDELPQLLNVLDGSMSLVGPRPALPREVRRYDLRQQQRLAVKPGLTGLWQCSGRSALPFANWVELDLDYIERWSLWLDVKLCLKTLLAVIRGDGAW